MARTVSSVSSAVEKGPKVRIVGPSVNPAEQLDKLDSEADKKEYQGWLTVREHLVSLSKRIRPREAALSQHLAAPKTRSPKFKGRRKTVVQKDFIGDDNARPAPSTTGSDQDIDARTHDFVDDVLDPPYPFDVLASLYENSGPLRRNVDAMAANVDGFGFRFEPVLDFDHPEVASHVRDLMFLEKLEQEKVDLKDLDDAKLESLEPPEADVKKRVKLWERIAMVERHHLHSKLESLHPKFTFTRLRIELRENLELFGNGAWEILREDQSDVYSKIEQAYNIPFASIRLVRQDKNPTSVKVKVRKDATRWDELTFQRFFRRYVRIVGTTRTYYKEFGDPRTVSRRTGRYYSSVEELRAEEGADEAPAHELLHFAIPSLLSPYGIARWMGALLAVLGNRAAEEVNYLYFDNKAIPPMVLLVSGGRLSESSVERLETFLQERLKGRENFHKILVIEGLPADAKESESELEPSGKLRLEIKPLTADMLQDGLFQTYDEANELKIGRAFRQPPLLTGDQRDANRSTADVIKAICEEQVYQPARDLFDADMDRLFLSNWGIRFWHFKTNAPVTRYPNDLVENTVKALYNGAITPNEARANLSDAFSKEFPHRPEPWAQVPPRLADAQVRANALQVDDPTGSDSSEDGASKNPKMLAGDRGDAAGGLPAGQDMVPQAKSRGQKVDRFLAAAKAIRRAVVGEVEAAKDDFFSPDYWEALPTEKVDLEVPQDSK